MQQSKREKWYLLPQSTTVQSQKLKILGKYQQIKNHDNNKNYLISDQ